MILDRIQLADDTLFGPGRTRTFSPFLAPGERDRLAELLGARGGIAGFAEDLRGLARRHIDDPDSLKLRAICLLVADLFDQGWRVDVGAGGITFSPPGLERAGLEGVEGVKARVRAGLQSARERQLREPSVRGFIARMERPRFRNGVQTSIADLVDDGDDLARALDLIRDMPEAERPQALAAVVEPVVEVCEAGRLCADTGLPLIDIWRYFRHTWAHEYRAIPGRQMMVLVRNAARRNRPVMGIAMLASPVMRLTARDRWIGWLRPDAEARIAAGDWSSDAFAQAILKRLDAAIAAIRTDDLVTEAELSDPTETVILRLEQRGAGAAAARQRELRDHYDANRDGEAVRPHRGVVRAADPDVDWRAASEDLLFVRKRAEGLAQLLFARGMFRGAKLADRPAEALEQLFGTRSGQRALDIALTEIRKAGLSSEVADVSVCGAVAPYNVLIGGKLTALILASREIREAYGRRYGDQVSVIASQMAGRAVTKPARLRVLTTTSLYGVGSSQYNRLKLRAADHPELSQDLTWQSIGQSLTGGFGTLHLGPETAQALRSMALSRHEARRVNNRFGEGTSPRLRQIREGLDALGLKSDAILHHANPRIFYGCELEPGARDALMGIDAAEDAPPSAADIAAAWRRRWLEGRVVRGGEALDGMADTGFASIQATLKVD
jgi:hypothetical protein